MECVRRPRNPRPRNPRPRNPKELALRLGLVEGSRVELTAEPSRIVISVDRPVYALDELLKGIRPGELQEAFDWGADRGREAVD